MIIDLASVGPEPKMVKASFDPADVDLEDEIVSLEGPLKFEGEVERSASRTHVRGNVDAPVLFNCTRCLEPFHRRLEVPFEAVFVDAAEETDAKEVEVGDIALDESLVDGAELNLADVVREQVLLALPIQTFCKEDCRGLCPKCGGNLNLIDCKCSDDEIDPRWAALKGLK